MQPVNVLNEVAPLNFIKVANGGSYEEISVEVDFCSIRLHRFCRLRNNH
jgi:hypothetical protein